MSALRCRRMPRPARCCATSLLERPVVVMHAGRTLADRDLPDQSDDVPGTEERLDEQQGAALKAVLVRGIETLTTAGGRRSRSGGGSHQDKSQSTARLRGRRGRTQRGRAEGAFIGTTAAAEREVAGITLKH